MKSAMNEIPVKSVECFFEVYKKYETGNIMSTSILDKVEYKTYILPYETIT